MNFKRRAAIVRHFIDTYVGPVMEDKGGAYSRGEENCNSNFYRVGEVLGDPMKACWTYALKHIDAISGYVKDGCDGKVIGSETVESRIGDAVNYLLILHSLLIQEGVLDDPVGGEETGGEVLSARKAYRDIAGRGKYPPLPTDTKAGVRHARTATEVEVLRENGLNADWSKTLQSRADIMGPVTWDADSYVWEQQQIGDFHIHEDGRVDRLHYPSASAVYGWWGPV